MPRKKSKRRRAARPTIAPWIVLAGSLAVIGFACTHTTVRTQTTVTPHPRSTPVPVTSAPSTTAPSAPIAPPASAKPAPVASNSATATAVPSVTSPPTALPSPAPSPAVSPHAGAAPAGTGARLAIIIDDCGQWPTTERGFIALPVQLTLSVLPDVRYNHSIERAAEEANKGVMLHLPMETLSGLDPGPGKVTTEMDDDAITAQVERDLANVELARGVNNHEGSKATADVRVMNDVMAVLARRDRFFIDSRTSGASIAAEVAAKHGVATAGRDVFLDNQADVAYTEDRLRAAAALAKRDGSAIAIGHPRPTTLTAVRAMIPELQAEGITFVLAADLTH